MKESDLLRVYDRVQVRCKEGYSNSKVMRTGRVIALTGEIKSIWCCIECNEAGCETSNRRSP